MAKSTNLKVTNIFSDETQNTVTISNIEDSTGLVENVRSNIKAFNENPAEFSNLMVSKYGGTWTGISKAQLVTTTKNYIF